MWPQNKRPQSLGRLRILNCSKGLHGFGKPLLCSCWLLSRWRFCLAAKKCQLSEHGMSIMCTSIVFLNLNDFRAWLWNDFSYSFFFLFYFLHDFFLFLRILRSSGHDKQKSKVEICFFYILFRFHCYFLWRFFFAVSIKNKKLHCGRGNIR